MLKTIIRKNNYQDSVNLMMLTGKINELDGVNKSQIMMGTESNKNILENGGLLTDDAKEASANDMVVVMDVRDEGITEKIMEEIEKFFGARQIKDRKQEAEALNLDEAVEKMSGANLAIFSIPGEYAAEEMKKALNLASMYFPLRIISPGRMKLTLRGWQRIRGY